MKPDWLTQAISKTRSSNQCSWLAKEYRSELGKQNNLDTLLTQTDDLFKHDKTTTVAPIQLGHSKLVLKRYNARNFFHHIKRALRQSRARRCWRMSYAFAEAGLSVARPVMMLEKRLGFIRRNAYFISEFSKGKELLGLLPTLDKTQQLEISRAFKQAVLIMRERQLSHGDMKASNILWYQNQLVFIDLDAAQQHSNTLTWQRAHHRDIRRFLKNWRDQPDILALFDWLKSDN